MPTALEAYHELSCYTLAHGHEGFLHQHAVDAFAAQTATAEDKPIQLAFALLGLYLHLERGFTGRQVQLAHMKLGRQRVPWPRFPIPEDRGRITVHDVLRQPAGPERDSFLRLWCADVWQ